MIMKPETITINLPDDYEGRVEAVLMKHPSGQETTRAVLYIHGYLDYYFQYHMGEFFASRGYDFYALDLRKYGRAWLPHQHFNYCRRMEEYFPEIDASIDRIIAAGNHDLTLMGHSTGGLLSALYCAEGSRRDKISRLVLNSPFLEFNTNWATRKIAIPIAGTLSLVFPYAHMKNVLSPNYFKSVHDSQYGEWNFDTSLKPAVAPPLYFAWLRAVRLAQKKVRHDPQLQMPVLVMFSDKSTYHRDWHEEAMESDTILNVGHIKRYGAGLGRDVTLEEVSGGLHDLVLSRKEVRDKVLETMETFMRTH